MKFMLALIWAVFILVATCNSDAAAFLYEQTVNFNVNPRPNFSNLFILYDIDFGDNFYLIQKIGHTLAFGILYALVFGWLKNLNKALLVCGLFALFTEVVQLYFERSGRLFDVGVDFVGILLAYSLCRLLNSHSQSAAVKR
ncbi:VanZ family protein [Planococcus sp. YIM B11945]|uniref:VanZ family protein n=1 Tax=Planococcus sp. YIM B11945 TaxID=3435410 RepID=UPI003D7D442F